MKGWRCGSVLETGFSLRHAVYVTPWLCKPSVCISLLDELECFLKTLSLLGRMVLWSTKF